MALETAVRVGTWLLRLVILASLLYGLGRRNASIGANALVAFGATFVPALVEYALLVSRGASVSVSSLVAFWIGAAGVLHVLGMHGLYEDERVWWWDHLTHLVSAALVAAVFYGAIAGVVAASPELSLPPGVVAALAFLLTLAVGVAWELVEFAIHRYSTELGVESVLIQYGRRDTALDLVFDAVGALLVVWLDVRILESVIAEIPGLTRWLLLATGAFVVVGSFGSVLVLFVVGGSGLPPE